MLLPKLGGFWLLPPRDFPHVRVTPMDHDSISSGHAKSKRRDPGALCTSRVGGFPALHPFSNRMACFSVVAGERHEDTNFSNRPCRSDIVLRPAVPTLAVPPH